ANCLRCLAEAAKLGPRALGEAALANKAYLRGLGEEVLAETGIDLPEFFPAAVQCLSGHALRGHTVVLVTGTPAPRAALVKGALERELMWRGLKTEVFALSTGLEMVGGRWSGRVLGRPMLGAEKARAAERFAAARGLALRSASAYGDHLLDRWLL